MSTSLGVHGDASRVGKFIQYKILYTEEVGDNVVEKDVSSFFFSCFIRYRDPPLTLHVPCTHSTITFPDGVDREKLSLNTTDNLLAVNTDFAMSRFFLSRGTDPNRLVLLIQTDPPKRPPATILCFCIEKKLAYHLNFPIWFVRFC